MEKPISGARENQSRGLKLEFQIGKRGWHAETRNERVVRDVGGFDGYELIDNPTAI